MPIGEIAADVFGGVLRITGRLLVEIVFELGVKGLGYLICRLFSRSVDPDGVLVTLTGLAAWLLVLMALYFGYEYISLQTAIDSCLDAGGSYNHATGQCNRAGS